ncbi:MAG: glutathione S-transferase family protein [Bdellovibrionota bacterium]
MPGTYRIFGSELSPYSVKVRSYFRYKKIPHEWVLRSMDKMPEFQKYAKLPLVPMVVTPEGQGIQDSSPIIEQMEAKFSEPSIHPKDPALYFLSCLIEEYADEWGNKPMFHYRWTYEADQLSAAERIAKDQMPPGSADPAVKATSQMVRQRMVPRLKFVGSSDQTKEIIEGSFKRQIAILEKHLAKRKYLFGNRPAYADFALYAQLYQCSTDPTPGAYMMQKAPNTLAWILRMLDLKSEGDFESWQDLKPTLFPLIRDEIGKIFFPWTAENAKAVAAGAKEFQMELDGRPYSQEPQKYHAKSLGVLKQKYAAIADKSALDPILEEAGCKKWLA